MKLDIVAQLVQILKDAPELGAIEVRRGLFGVWSSVRVSKAGHGSTNAGAQQVFVERGPAVAFVAGEGGRGRGEGAPAAAPGAAAPAVQLLEIKSPMVGTLYRAPEPGAEPYVKVGSRVSTGQVVCIIEAMKIMNEIESEVHGVVREVCVENTQPVEFGQVLFRVDPNG
ncbi:MAG: acetyl-CoA carboxylase biotin carboxyl carrier protein [Gemmatimonadales bacterium]